ncbi:MAG TPA: DUF397 domain-containing protein [Pseudonocardiaceae bacterium]
MANWRKSTHSANNATCVEVGWSAGQVGYRDTKQAGLHDRPILLFGEAANRAFLRAATDGQFDHS